MKIKAHILLLVLMAKAFQGMGVSAPKMNLGFVETNKWKGRNSLAESNPDLFVHKGNGLTVLLRSNGFSYELFQYKKQEPYLPLLPEQVNNKAPEFIGHRIDIDFVGSNQNASIEPSLAGEGIIRNYSPDNIGKYKESKHYGRVLYKNIYPKIDIEFLIEDHPGQTPFKYNFILHPGANSKDIKLLIRGADKLKITEKGAISIQSSCGLLEERIPLSYELNSKQEKGSSVAAVFEKIGSSLFGIETESYNLNKTLVIDPVPWCTYFGGLQDDYAQNVACDNSGNVFISGRTLSTNGIATAGAFQGALSGSNYDAFIAKYNGSGVLQWASYFGGPGDENGLGISIDKDQNIIICGSTSSTSGIASALAYQPLSGGMTDCFVARVSTSGLLMWSTYFGYENNDQFNAVNCEKDGDINLIGSSSSITKMPFTNIHKDSNTGSTEIIYVKMNTSGNVKLGTYYGGIAQDGGMGICSDAAKNIYFVGYSISMTGIATPGAYRTNNQSSIDGFLIKMDSTTKQLFGTYYGGNTNDYFYDVAVGKSGKIIAVGAAYSSSGIALTGAFQSAFGGGVTDAMAVQFDFVGIPDWGTYMGGDGYDFYYSVKTDDSSNVYCAGYTASTNNIASANALQPVLGGDADGLLSKFNSNGNRIWGTYYGSSKTEIGKAVALDNNGNLFFIGETTSDTGITTTGSQQPITGGLRDVFLLKIGSLSVVDSLIHNNTISPNQGVCLGNAAQNLTGSTPVGGSGTYTYLWLYSPSGLPGTYAPASGTNTNDFYIPGFVSQHSFYRRIVKSGTKSDTSNAVEILVSNSFNAGFTVNKTIQCLKKNQFIFTDTTFYTFGGLSYLWNFGNGKISTKQTDTIHYDPAVINNYSVRLITSLNGACSDTNYKIVYTITDPVQKTITGKDTVLKGNTEVYSVSATTGSSYNWIYTNGTGHSTINNILIKWNLIGDVEMKLVETNGGGCISDTNYKSIYVKQPLGEEDNLLAAAINIFPNPSRDGLFYFETPLNQNFNLAIFDIAGSLILQKQQSTIDPINLTQLNDGLYTLQLLDSIGNMLHTKVVLMH